MNEDENVPKEAVEQLLESPSEHPEGYKLNLPQKVSAKEKNKAATQRKAIEHDLDSLIEG
jgi:hypothetical protein